MINERKVVEIATLNNLLNSGGAKFLQGLQSNGSISVDCGASGNAGAIHLGNAAHKFAMHISTGNTVGLYDQTYNKWMLSCDSSGNVIHAGGSVSGSLTIPTTEAANRFLRTSNSKQNLAFGVWADGTAGIWDYKNNNWLIKSDASYNITLNGSASDNVLKAGDTMTGHLTINETSPTTDHGITVKTSAKEGHFGIGKSSGNLGIWDQTKSKWIVYSDQDGDVVLNGKANNVTVADGTSKNAWYRIVHGGTSGLLSTGSAQILDNASSTSTMSTYLVLGNNTATGTAGNKRGILRLYDEGTHDVNIQVTGKRTGQRWYSIPFIDDNCWITGYAANWNITRPSSYTQYRVPICVGTQGQLSTDNSYFVEMRSGTTSQQGNMKLMLGNSVAEGTDGNMRGGLRLYAQNNTYAEINGTTGPGLYVTENAAAGAILRNIQISTTDLTAGSSALTNGRIYLVYE